MTSFSPVTPAGLQNAIDDLKRRNGGKKLLTNYFLQPLHRVANLRMLESEKNLYFLHDEWDFARFYSYTFDVALLEHELAAVSWPPVVVTDWISKTDPGAVEERLSRLDFHLHATYDRIVCKSMRCERPNGHMCLAREADRDVIHALLFRVFDKYADHIMPIEELGELISQRQVLLSHDSQHTINGLALFGLSGQTCNYNFLYNSGGPLTLSLLLGNLYGVLTERGVHSGCWWVRRTRPLVVKLHESFGWKKDGLVDRIYLRS
jgi:hypothetical protein